MSSLMTDNSQDRVKLGISRSAGTILCALMLNIILMPMVNAFGGGPGAWTTAFAILGRAACVMFLVCFLGTKKQIEGPKKKKDIVPIKIALKALVTNKYWWNRMCFALATTFISATGAVNVYYATYFLGNDELAGILSIASLLPMIITLFLSGLITGKIGKRNTALLGSAQRSGRA